MKLLIPMKLLIIIIIRNHLYLFSLLLPWPLTTTEGTGIAQYWKFIFYTYRFNYLMEPELFACTLFSAKGVVKTLRSPLLRTQCLSPLYNRTRWLGVKHQLTYLLTNPVLLKNSSVKPGLSGSEYSFWVLRLLPGILSSLSVYILPS